MAVVSYFNTAKTILFSLTSSKLGGRVQERVSLMFWQTLSASEHSQKSPEKFSGQEQVNESTPSLHLPPFKHLLRKQISIGP